MSSATTQEQLTLATAADVREAASLTEHVAATLSDDLLRPDVDTFNDLRRLAIAGLRALLALDRDACELPLATALQAKKTLRALDRGVR